MTFFFFFTAVTEILSSGLGKKDTRGVEFTDIQYWIFIIVQCQDIYISCTMYYKIYAARERSCGTNVTLLQRNVVEQLQLIDPRNKKEAILSI